MEYAESLFESAEYFADVFKSDFGIKNEITGNVTAGTLIIAIVGVIFLLMIILIVMKRYFN